MQASELIEKLKVLTGVKTLYVNGAWGWPLSEANKQRAIAKNAYNAQAPRANKIKAASSDTYGFDCVCMIKGIMWGWTGDRRQRYGGAGYAINGVPDINADQMMAICTNKSTDFSEIIPGAAVWLKGHIGVYIGDGLVIECTPLWDDGVQITSLEKRPGYHQRKWSRWGLLPFIEYDEEDEMSYDQFKDYMKQYEAEKRNEPADAYAIEALEWAKEKGILLGDSAGNLMPQSPIKRQDMVLLLQRQEKSNGK